MAALRLREPLVPSSSVLRYLRSQVNDLCLFTQNHRQDLDATRGLNRYLLKARRRTETWSSSSPLFRAPNNQRYQQLESSLLPFSIQATPTKCVSPRARSTTRKLSTPTIRAGDICRQTRQASWARRLMGLGSKKRDFGPNDDDPSMVMNDQGVPILGRMKLADQLKLRCTEFDEYGNVTLVSGEFKKQELIAKYGLLPRDLRKIDSSMLPHILVRESSILINLLHLRVLIKHDRVLVFDVYGSSDSYSQSVFMYDLEHKLRQDNTRSIGSLPYEFRALEAVLLSATGGLEQEFEQVRVPVVRVLKELEEDIDREKLRYLLVHSKRMSTFEQRARLVRDAIDNVLEEDDDLSSMYLSETAQGKPRKEDDHTEVEMLLESYHKVCDEIVQASSNLVSDIRNTEEIIRAILDANRNALMLLDLKFSIGTLGMGSGAFMAALYGMNLKNYMEDWALGFAGMTGFSFALAMLVVVYGLQKLRRVQRVSMWGEQGRQNRGNWRDLDPMPALPGESGRQRWKRLNEARRLALRQDEADPYGSSLGGFGAGIASDTGATGTGTTGTLTSTSTSTSSKTSDRKK